MVAVDNLRSVWLRRTFIATLVLAIAIVVVGRLVTLDNVFLTVWGDRDLWRALSVPAHWPMAGAESTGGVRAPGGAFYLLLAGIFAIKQSVVAVNTAAVLLFIVAIFVMGVFFARRVSPLAGAVTAAALASSVILNEVIGVWNPGFVLIFAVAVTLFGYSFLTGGRPLSLGLATAALAVGMQIHLQITQIAAGLVLAIAIYRPLLTWRHAAALLVGLLFPYLPNIATGSALLLKTAASLPNDALNTYVFWDVSRLLYKLNLFERLFGAGVSEFVDRSYWLQVPLGASEILVAVLVAWTVFTSIGPKGYLFKSSGNGFLALILLVNFATVLVSDLEIRHMVAAAPAAAALVGLAGERLLTYLHRRGAIAQVIAAIVCCLIALRPFTIGVAMFAPRPFYIASVTAQSEIASTIKPHFYADRNDFEEHVAEFTRTGSSRWLVVSNGIPNHMSFLYQTFPTTDGGTNRKECIAIVAKSDLNGDPRNDLAASPSLAGLGATFNEPATESVHFLYFPYTTRDGNCLKTFPNGYIPTAFEASYLAADTPAEAKVVNGGILFVVPQQGHRDPTGIEIRHENSDYIAIFHGRLLRGYTGLYFRSIVSPVLCFVGEQAVRLIRFGNVTIGSPQRATLAPWRSAIFTLPDGRYRLWLIGSDGRLPIAIRDIVGDLIVPTMGTAIPLSTAPEPPAECLGKEQPASQR